MAGIRKHKLSDSIQPPKPKSGGKRGYKPVPTHRVDPEQTREAKESEDAGNAVESTRDRMVDIGRGNQQAGRQGQ
jgi:hypothetical protein